MTRYQVAMQGINSWRRQPFKYGMVDCCQFINHMIRHITGKDFAASFDYGSEEEAYQLIAGQGSLSSFLVSVLGPTSESLEDGDPVVCELPIVGEFAGIKLQNQVVCLTEKGMIRVPDSKIICGWSLCHQ